MTTARLVGSLPEPETNGLSPIAGTCASDPGTLVTVVATLRVRKIEDDLETGERCVKFELEEIEPVGGADESFVAACMRNVRLQRTGVQELSGFEDAAREE